MSDASQTRAPIDTEHPSSENAAVGRLRYDGASGPIQIDDITLAHVKVVISTKLRRQESFMMSWRPVDGGQDGRISVWVHTTIPLQFRFDSPERPALDPHRIETMMRAINATGELILDGLVTEE